MITVGGHRYGTASQIAAHLGHDIRPDRVRDWARRGLLQGEHAGGRTYYRLDQAAEIERRTRTSTRGRTRAA